MADPTMTGPQDEGLKLQASVTKTADFNSTAIDLGSGFAPGGGGRPMQAIVNYSAADFTTTDETYDFWIEDSADNSTFTKRSAPVRAVVSATQVAGSVTIPCGILQRYVRLVLDVAGTTPSITYLGYLQPQVNA
jgi:hypothetical protein